MSKSAVSKLPVYEVNFNDDEIEESRNLKQESKHPTKIHFFHIRKYNAWGEPKNNAGTTIAAKIDAGLNGILYTKARCSKRDNFCKKIGREIAAGRLNCNKGLNFYQGTDFRAFKTFLFGEKHESVESQEDAYF